MGNEIIKQLTVAEEIKIIKENLRCINHVTDLLITKHITELKTALPQIIDLRVRKMIQDNIIFLINLKKDMDITYFGVFPEDKKLAEEQHKNEIHNKLMH